MLPDRIAIDIGGTFTDVVADWGAGRVRTTKFLSSLCAEPAALAAHLRAWLGAGDAAPRAEPPRVIHATTVATNALLEGLAARAALITTEGFRDVLELGRGIRPDPLDLRWRPLPPVVPREWRLTVPERIAADGSVVVPLQLGQADADRLVTRLQGRESVAICLINSHANPAHEIELARLLRERLPGVFVTCSHEVNPEPREYERTSTTAINAALGPVVTRYLAGLEAGLASAGFHAPLAVMQSNGGTLAAELVKRKPVTIVESGPAAGVLAVLGIARELGEPDVIALDIGGTTAKASLVEGYEILEANEYYVGGGMHAGPRAATSAGYVIRMPSLDIAEVGAGGGSIASVDEAGGLHVGPRSAGARPGPAGYGIGGESATVTDANILLGYINPREIAGGQQTIHRHLSSAAMLRHVGEARGCDAESAALVVHTGANAKVLAALRAVTIERGRDPRQHLIVAFGGSGPVHAGGIADLLGVSRVFIPFGAGVLSAAGLLAASAAADVTHAFSAPLIGFERDTAMDIVARLTARMQAEYQLGAQDMAEAQALVTLRYVGQHTEIAVPLPEGDGPPAAALQAAFEAQYASEFGFTLEGGVLEVMGLRLRLRRPPPPGWAALLEGLGQTWRTGAAKGGTRRLRFDGFEGDCPILSLEALEGGAGAAGPAVIETPDTTVVVPPGWTARTHRNMGVLLCK